MSGEGALRRHSRDQSFDDVDFSPFSSGGAEAGEGGADHETGESGEPEPTKMGRRRNSQKCRRNATGLPLRMPEGDIAAARSSLEAAAAGRQTRGMSAEELGRRASEVISRFLPRLSSIDFMTSKSVEYPTSAST